MNIAITGSSGLVGSRLVQHLRDAGHTVTRVVRSREAATESDAIYWSPSRGEIDADGIARQDAVVNLAGENIFGVWTEAKKRRIRESRVKGTTLLAQTIAGLDDDARPGVLVNASAIGWYGDRPADVPMTEDAPPGDGFMADVVREWEASTGPAEAAGVRVVLLRFGLVLDPDGLLLQGMATSTRLGLGAKLGDGDQPFPWTTTDEIARVVEYVLHDDGMNGPVNVVAPDRVTNEEFADAVARVLDRPRLLRIPSFAVKLAGDLGDELLSGAWVVPERLNESGYTWKDGTLEAALRRLLGR